MADVAIGSIQAGAGLAFDVDTVGNTVTVSGLSFQPKALVFWVNGIQNAADATSEALSLRYSMGFAASTSDRRCVSAFNIDASGSMDTAVMTRDDGVIHV